MKNKKGQTSTDTPILLSIVVFQAFILICLGFLDMNENDITLNTYGGGIINFIFNMISNIAVLSWGNLLIFAPLGIALTYIIAKLIRGGG